MIFNVTLKHTPSSQARLTAWSSCLKSVSEAEQNTAERSGQNPESIFQGEIYCEILARTASIYQKFEKLLWTPSEDPSQKSFWNQMSLKKHIKVKRPTQQTSANSK